MSNGATSVTGGRTFIRPGIPTLPELFSAAGYSTDFWFDRAMAWMKERHAARQPFLCCLPLNAPHGPHGVPEKYSAPYEGKGPAKFFGMIANIDENIGRLEAFLRDMGLRDDTILIFMTDHGGTAGVKLWNAGLRAGKTTFYDVRADRAQQNDLAVKHPDIVTKLCEHYERWWAELEPLSGQFVTTSLGAEAQPVVTLTSSDWQDVHADNAGHIRQAAGGPRGGHWNVRVERTGDYEITLRRWPAEADTSLTAPNGADSRALPIAGARLAVAGQDLSARAGVGENAVTLRTRLPSGTAQMQAWFVDTDNDDLCGAFYTTVRRLP
jgi:hypothetical protein